MSDQIGRTNLQHLRVNQKVRAGMRHALIFITGLMATLGVFQSNANAEAGSKRSVAQTLVHQGDSSIYIVNERAPSLSMVARDLYGDRRFADQIAKWNGLSPQSKLKLGQRLKILEKPTESPETGTAILIKWWGQLGNAEMVVRLGGAVPTSGAVPTKTKLVEVPKGPPPFIAAPVPTAAPAKSVTPVAVASGANKASHSETKRSSTTTTTTTTTTTVTTTTTTSESSSSSNGPTARSTTSKATQPHSPAKTVQPLAASQAAAPAGAPTSTTTTVVETVAVPVERKPSNDPGYTFQSMPSEQGQKSESYWLDPGTLQNLEAISNKLYPEQK